MRKLSLIPTITILVVLALTGCSEEMTESERYKAMLVGNIYYTSEVREDESLKKVHGKAFLGFVKFYKDDVVEWVDMIHGGGVGREDSDYRYKKFHGVYELDGRKLTITLLGEEPLLCIVEKNGKGITYVESGFSLFDIATFDTDGNLGHIVEDQFTG